MAITKFLLPEDRIPTTWYNVVPELPVAVLHRGNETWLVSARGRVVKRVQTGTYPALARIWVPRKADVAIGAFLASAAGGTAARTIAKASADDTINAGSPTVAAAIWTAVPRWMPSTETSPAARPCLTERATI